MGETSQQPLRILISGGAGFIGSHLIKHFINETAWTIVCIDKLTQVNTGWDRLKE